MSLDLSAWREQAIRWLSAAAIAAITAFAFLFVSVLAQAGADGTPVNSKLESVSVTPTLKVELDADRSQAVPGDTISYEGVVSNDAAALSLGGDVAVLNRFSSDARLASYFAFIEYFSADTRKWTPLAGMWNREDGFTANQRPDIDTGLSLGLTRLTMPGVTFPAVEDSELGTSLAKGATAQWKLSAKAPLSHAQLRFLQDERQVKNIRLVVRFDLQQTGSNERDGETEKQMFTAGLRPLSSDLEDVVVTLGLPDGQSVEIDKQDDPRLTRLTPGAAADFAGVFQLAALVERGLSESTLDYLDRLTGENGKRFNASASARATAGAGASIDGTPVGDPRAVSSEEANVSTQQQLPIVSLAKSGPAEVGAGTSATYAFLLENIGSSTAWITLTDEVDGGAPVPVEVSPSQVAPGEQARGEHVQHVSVKRKPGVMRDTGALSWLDRNDNSYGAVTDSFETMVIDITPPEPPVIGARPDPLTNKTTAQFTWTGEDEGFYECRLDGGSWSPCDAPHELSEVAEGDREFEVRQTDDSGNVSEPSMAHWQVDVTPPHPPVITSGPSGPTNATSATFSFEGETGGAFECRLNQDDWATCASEFGTDSLADGEQTFDVRQIDDAGNVGAGRGRTWVVDTVAPIPPVFTRAPVEFSNEASAAFSLAHPEAVAIECSLDDGSFQPCFEDVILRSLAGGHHFYRARAVDPAGNVSPSAMHAWTVDLTPPPPPVIDELPGNVSPGAEAAVRFSGEEGATFQCTVDTGESLPCASPQSVGGLSSGDHSIAITQRDRAGNQSQPVSGAWSVRHSSGIVPPPLSDSSVESFASQTSFLYTGSNPVQTGVSPSAIDSKRVAILRGNVQSENGSPLAGVTVRIPTRPEFGLTTTRPDGGFYLAVNGGEKLTVRFEKSGHLPIDRYSEAAWNEYEFVDDVRMLELDSRVTTVDLSSPLSPPQVAAGTPEVDQEGERQAKVLFTTGTTATMTLPNGSKVPLPELNVRATEYTVGDHGPERMPGPLPPQSAYTYAVELSIDEAIAAGATKVEFSKPVFSYTDNFLDYPVGEAVPSGYYDFARSAWIPSADGRIVELIGEEDDKAILAVTASGAAASAAELASLGITDQELAKLIELYDVGDSIWRVPLHHFSAWDFNWPFSAPPDADLPGDNREPGEQDCPGNKSGSIIECDNQVLGEEIDLVGTPHSLTYRSDRAPGRNASRSLEIPVTDGSVSLNLIRVIVEVEVAGRLFKEKFGPAPNQIYHFNWDGLDAFGRAVRGATFAEIRVRNQYVPFAYRTGGFKESFGRFSSSGVAISRARDKSYIDLATRFQRRIGTRDALLDHLGGWNLDVHHSYDQNTDTLHLGSGERRSAGSMNREVRTVAGNADILSTYGDGWSCKASNRRGDNLPAIDATLYMPSDIEPDGLGGYYVLDSGNRAIRRVDQDGIMRPVLFFACSHPTGISRGPNGSLYYVVDSKRVYQRSTDGTIRHIAGAQYFGNSGDGGPATAAQFSGIGGITLDSDGGLLITDQGNRVIHRVRTDGIVNTIAGNGSEWISGDGNQALDAGIARPGSIAVGPDGSIYFTTSNLWNQGHVIRKIDPSGRVSSLVGKPTCTADSGDGGPATAACVKDPTHVAFTREGDILIADSGHNRIRRIDQQGRIWPYAGAGTSGFSGEGGSASRANFSQPRGMEVMPDDTVLIADSGNHRIRRVQEGVSQRFGDNTVTVGSEDGREIYVFSSAGRHLKTVDSKTAAVIWEFAYDANGRLITVTDADGNETRFERAADGRSITVRGPYGSVNTMQLTDSSQLSEGIEARLLRGVERPDGAQTALSYSEGGLMRSYTRPGGGSSQFEYDADGLLISDTDALGNRQTLSRSTPWRARNVEFTTGEGRTSHYKNERLPSGNTQRSYTNEAGLTSVSTELSDNRVRNEQPNGARSVITSGGDPRLGFSSPTPTVETTLPSGKSSKAEIIRTADLSNRNDPFSLTKLVEQLLLNGKSTSTTYTAANRKYVTTTPAGRSETTTVDQVDRPLRSERPGNSPVEYAYDSRGRMANVASGNRTVSFAYGNDGRLQSTTDPLMRTTSFDRDALGRVTRQTGPDGRSIDLSYDHDGNLTAIKPPGRSQHVFAFDLAGLAASYAAPGQDEVAATKYRYDRDHKLTSLIRSDGSLTEIGYDSAGRMSQIDDPSWGTSTLSYSATTGNLTRLESPDGQVSTVQYDGFLPTRETSSGAISGSVAASYDNDFRVSSTRVNDGPVVSNAFDLDGLLTRAGDMAIAREASTGRVASTAVGAVSTTHAYNEHAEPTGITSTVNGETLVDMAFARDALGRITAKTETTPAGAKTTTYLYDEAGRLIQVNNGDAETVTYTYDENGNRTSRTTSSGEVEAGVVDQQDKLLSYGGYSFEHDQNGDFISKTRISDDETTKFDYDASGNLQAVDLPSGKTVEYVIDASGRRVGKMIDGQFTQGFLYGGPLQPIAELDATGTVKSRFVYGMKANVPEYMVRGGVTYRIITDHLGSPRFVVNSTTGDIAQEVEYDEFGRVLEDTNPGFQPFGFAGGIRDSHTGLVRFGARDYDPLTGRWTTKDPIGFAGGDANLYGYVAGDPVNFYDPTGEIIDTIVDVGFVVYDVGKIVVGAIKGCVSRADVAALAADVGATFLPGVTGAGLMVRAGAKSRAAEQTLVIGRTKDLTAPGALRANEHTLLPRLAPDLGSPKANWKRNSSELRSKLRNGTKQIRDASPGDTSGQFLNAERNLLENRGWTFESGYWRAR